MPGPTHNPLFDLHRQAQAEFQPYGELEIVSTFGEPQAEYAAIRKSAALMDLPQRGIIELSGKDRLPFLNNLLTNQTWDKQTKSGLSAGRSIYAFLLNAKSGRIITDVNALELGERTLLELEARLVSPILESLEKYRFAEQVKFASKLDELHEIALHGPGASEVIAQSVEGDLPQLAACGSARMLGHDVIIWRDDPCGVPGYHLIIPSNDARAIWMHFVTRFANADQLGKRPLRPVGWAAFNSTRIEAGRALFGIDFDESILPAETGPDTLARAVSFTKGCYPGQEIVARMHARHQLAKQLVGIRIEGDALPIAGAQIFDAKGEETIGGVTSSTLSPVLSNIAICMGYVKRPHFAVGTKLLIPAEGKMRAATVVQTPFIARSGETS
jgi:folate-binding protein YgfZ